MLDNILESFEVVAQNVSIVDALDYVIHNTKNQIITAEGWGRFYCYIDVEDSGNDLNQNLYVRSYLTKPEPAEFGLSGLRDRTYKVLYIPEDQRKTFFGLAKVRGI